MSQVVVVHIAVDTWRGTDLQSSLIGAWTYTDAASGPADAHGILDTVREALGASYRPATVDEILEWHRAFAPETDVPWEQISLF